MSNFAQLDAQSLELALARLRLMYVKPEHPYYILAPAYRETSSGIVSLHYLCHMLNLNGREAYICGTDGVNPELKTPLLDATIAQRHVAAGKVPIAVYPEVVSGNPLNCSVVSRFLLNFEGFISGKSMDAAAGDLFFYYAARLAEHRGHVGGDLLCLPTIDVQLFSAGVPGAVREGRYLYQNRHPLAQIDYAQLPVDIQLLSMANALTLPELATLLRKAEVMYSYEWSMTCVIAVLCGCPVIFMPGHGVDQRLLDNSFFGCVGFAMFDQPDALEHARTTLGEALQRYVQCTAPFWQQLDIFIAKTQAAASREALGNPRGVLDWLRQRYPQKQHLRLINECLANSATPSLAILVLANDDRLALTRTLDSLEQSQYPHLQVHVLGGTDPGRAGAQWAACDTRYPATAINGLLDCSPSHWFMLVEAGEELIAGALLVTALNLLDTPDSCCAVYADEVVRTSDGVIDIALRPDLNLDLLLAFPGSLSRHWIYRRDAWLQQAGFDSASGQAFELSYQLRLINERGLASIGHISEPLLVANSLRQSICTDEQAVLDAHLLTRGYVQACAHAVEMAPGRYRIDYGHELKASVSILIYLQGQLVDFQRCLESLLTQTTHIDYEVLLIEPGSEDPALLEWLEMIGQMGERFQVLRFMPGQARAAMCNAAAQEARGEYLLWLDARSAVLEADWLQALLNHAQRPEVGVVGGKLQAVDGSVHQAGLVLGLGGTVGHAFEGLSSQAAGYMGRLGLEHNCSAVGGACMMLRRALFLEAGGFDSDPLLAPWVDVDLGLRLHQAGYLNVWTPYARLLLDPLPGIRASDEQEDALYARWLPQLARDPAYNTNFSLRADKGFALEKNELSCHPLRGRVPMVLACVTDQQAAGHSRLLQPLSALLEAGQVDGAAVSSLLSPVEVERFAPTSVVLQRPLDDDGLLAMRRLRAFSRAFKVYDLDGYLPEMGLKDDCTADELLERLRIGLMQADRVLVATPALAEMLQGQHEDVRVLESVLPASWGKLQGQRCKGTKPRLGWLGGKDTHLLSDVVPALAGEVEWVVLGDCPDHLRPFLTEQHPEVEHQHLGSTLVTLSLDLALVPMADTFGNACAGDLRVLQHAACGHPVICSRVAGFVGGEVLPLSRVCNQTADWIRAIRLHLDDREASAALGDTLQSAVRKHWLLEGDRLDAWRRAWLAD